MDSNNVDRQARGIVRENQSHTNYDRKYIKFRSAKHEIRIRKVDYFEINQQQWNNTNNS
jgi:hypothetical protein